MYRLGRCGMRAEMIRALNGQVGAGRRLNSKAGALALQWSYIAPDENVRFAMSRATSLGHRYTLRAAEPAKGNRA